MTAVLRSAGPCITQPSGAGNSAAACGLRMAQWVSDHFPAPYASPPAGLLCSQCH